MCPVKYKTEGVAINYQLKQFRNISKVNINTLTTHYNQGKVEILIF